MVTLSTVLMSALVQTGGAVAPAADNGLVSSAAIGGGNSTAILVALAIITIGGVGALVAGDRVRRRETTRRNPPA
ncbi:MAG: hypothetical protein ACYC2G_03335 [Gemmatimonadaceae bacterium]